MSPFYWAILTACVWGIAPIVEKLGLAKAAPLPGLLLRSVGVIIGILAIIAIRFNTVKEAFTIKPLNAVYIIIGGILASIIGQLCFYHALKYGESSKVVPLAATYPLIAFVLAVIFLKEAVTVAKIAGILFVLLGIVLLK